MKSTLCFKTSFKFHCEKTKEIKCQLYFITKMTTSAVGDILAIFNRYSFFDRTLKKIYKGNVIASGSTLNTSVNIGDELVKDRHDKIYP